MKKNDNNGMVGATPADPKSSHAGAFAGENFNGVPRQRHWPVEIALRNFLALGVCLGLASASAGPDRPTKFSEIGGVANTRHNMTQSTTLGGSVGWAMASSRNDYGEVCVYCHTPHGANTQTPAPLWNRTVIQTTYTTYDALRTVTLTQPISQPGRNSLACLSCHDGQVAIDSIVNMPGSGYYRASQMSSMNNDFLNSWIQGGFETPALNAHLGLASNAAAALGETDTCLTCHVPGTFTNATDFRVFLIGTDLTNDHPVGIKFALGKPDFRQPGGSRDGLLYYDGDGNGRMTSNEIRLYDTGNGPAVECASCHDPHGVPSAGPGTKVFPSFLRVSNAGSGVCLTCHNK